MLLHYDADFDMIAGVTGQRCEWILTAGSIDLGVFRSLRSLTDRIPFTTCGDPTTGVAAGGGTTTSLMVMRERPKPLSIQRRRLDLEAGAEALGLRGPDVAAGTCRPPLTASRASP